MIHAELDVRHTRTHMPTRRVALARMWLPTGGSADGLVLVDAVVRTFLPLLDEEQRDAFAPVLAQVRAGTLEVPSISMRYRLQDDLHGLDRSRHRIVEEEAPGWEMLAPDERPRHRVIELDTHAAPVPQLLGVVLAARALPPTARQLVLRAVDEVVRDAYVAPAGYRTRFLADGVPREAPWAPGSVYAPPSEVGTWAGVGMEQRWAMEVFGMAAGSSVTRDEVQRRFRRLLRLAHPDQGAESRGAAERISELAEAREILLADADGDAAEA